MSTTLAPDAKTRVAFSEAVFLTDLLKPDSAVIPVAVLLEVVSPHNHGLAMRGTSTPEIAALETISSFNRRFIATLDRALSQRFLAAWENAQKNCDEPEFKPGRSLAYLADECVPTSLAFSSPEIVDVTVYLDEMDATQFQNWAAAVLNTRWDALVRQQVPSSAKHVAKGPARRSAVPPMLSRTKAEAPADSAASVRPMTAKDDILEYRFRAKIDTQIVPAL